MTENIERVIKRVEKFNSQERYDSALKLLNELLEEYPDDLTILNQIANTYHLSGKKQQAIKHFLLSADEYIKRKNYDLAQAVFKKIVRIDADNALVFEKYANLDRELGHLSEAIQNLKSASRNYRKDGNNEKALDLLIQAIDIDPTNQRLRLELADLYRSVGRLDEAINEYLAFVENFLLKGDIEGATNILENILKLNAKNISALIKMAEISILVGDKEKAYNLYKQILELKPKDADIIYSLAVKYYELFSDTEIAVDMLKQAHLIEPNNIYFLLKIKEIYPRDLEVRQALKEYYLEKGMKSEAINEIIGLAEIFEESGNESIARKLRQNASELIKDLDASQKYNIPGLAKALASEVSELKSSAVDAEEPVSKSKIAKTTGPIPAAASIGPEASDDIDLQASVIDRADFPEEGIPSLIGDIETRKQNIKQVTLEELIHTRKESRIQWDDERSFTDDRKRIVSQPATSRPAITRPSTDEPKKVVFPRVGEQGIDATTSTAKPDIERAAPPLKKAEPKRIISSEPEKVVPEDQDVPSIETISKVSSDYLQDNLTVDAGEAGLPGDDSLFGIYDKPAGKEISDRTESVSSIETREKEDEIYTPIYETAAESRESESLPETAEVISDKKEEKEEKEDTTAAPQYIPTQGAPGRLPLKEQAQAEAAVPEKEVISVSNHQSLLASMESTEDTRQLSDQMNRLLNSMIGTEIPDIDDDIETGFNLALSYMEMSLYDDAISELELILDDQHHRLKIFQLLGLAYAHKRNFTLAIDWYKRALALLPEDSEERVDILFNVGDHYLTLNDYKTSYVYFMEVYKSNPKYHGLMDKLELINTIIESLHNKQSGQ